MYRVATFLVEHFWGNPGEMADSLGVLLLTWNQAFYRYGPFDFDALEECISRHQGLLDRYRGRNILSYAPADDRRIERLFEDFRTALQICEGARTGAKSPVSAAKALHLLAPGFFPLWDHEIARVYGCSYNYKPARKYLAFLAMMNKMSVALHPSVEATDGSRTLLKLIDQYNYAKYTKEWI